MLLDLRAGFEQDDCDGDGQRAGLEGVDCDGDGQRDGLEEDDRDGDGQRAGLEEDACDGDGQPTGGLAATASCCPWTLGANGCPLHLWALGANGCQLQKALSQIAICNEVSVELKWIQQ